MDRRQVLAGMAAMVVVGSLNLSQLLHAQSSETQTGWPPPRYAHLFDGETRGLLGPVKMCIEESGPGYATTSEYGPDHKLLRESAERDGQIVYSSSFNSEESDAQPTIQQSSNRTEWFYGANGTKTSIETLDPKNPYGAGALTGFLGSSIPFGVPVRGSVITTYDERDNPVELRMLTADGQLATQLVRKFDASGRLVEEKPLQQNLALEVLERMTPEQKGSIPPQQLQAIIKGINEMGRGKLPPESTYKYDAQGRLIEKRERNMILEHTTTIDYNDRGDIERKHETFKNNSVLPQGASFSVDEEGNTTVSNHNPERTEDDSPRESDVRYSYQYDSFNNWTEKVVSYDFGDKTTTSTTRRTITYY